MTRSAATAMAALAAALLLSSCSQPVVTTPTPQVDPELIRAHVAAYRRAQAAGLRPGGAGEQQSVAYTKSQFESMGLTVQTPAVPLTRIRPTRATVSLTGAGGARTLAEGTDVVAWTRRHEPTTSTEGDVIFVGYGISTPRQGWDDFKDVDVRGKILLVLLGDPHVGQRHLLGTIGGDLFGRARYKFEEAERRGARGVLLVHLDDQADEPWDQVRQDPIDILDDGEPGKATPHMPFEGWISLAAAGKIFSDSSIDFLEQLTKAEEPNFQPIPLPVRASAQIQSDITGVSSTNVVATIPPLNAPAEYVLFSTQWNDLPVGGATGADLTDRDPTNQAPAGVSITLEIARALSQVRTPHRGFVFLVVTAESQGLLGIDSYLSHPTYSEVTTRAAIHVAGFNVHGSDNRVAIIGAAYEALKGMVRERASEQFRIAEGDHDLERLHFFRPAKASYTLKQIPGIFLSSGGELDSAATPVEKMDMTVAVLDTRLLYRVGMQVATADNWPGWEPSRTILDIVPGGPAVLDSRRSKGIR